MFAQKRPILFLTLLCTGLYLVFLGNRDLWFPDELDVGTAALEMLRANNVITPTRNGEIWIDYPPAPYWGGIVFARIFGELSAFALRLPSALMATLLVLMTYVFGQRWLCKKEARIGALVLATSPHFLYQAISAHVDMMFAGCIGIGLFAYTLGLDEPSKRRSWMFRAFAFALFGVAFQAKWALGILLPGFVITLWHGSRREWRYLLEQAPLVLVSALVVLPWAYALGEQIGWEVFWNAFYEQNFARFLSAEGKGHGRPWHYFLVRFWVDFAPWSLFLPFAMYGARELWSQRYARLLLIWAFALLVFFSLASTKREVYLLPAYPAFALLIGHGIGRCISEFSFPRGLAWPKHLLTGLYALIGVTGVVGPFMVPALLVGRDLPPPHEDFVLSLRLPLFVIGVISLGAALTMWRSLVPRQFYNRLATAHVLLCFIAVAWVLPLLDGVKTYRPHAHWLRGRVQEGDPIGMFFRFGDRRKLCGFLFDTERRVRVIATAAELAGFFRDHPSSLAVVEEQTWQERVVPRDLGFEEVHHFYAGKEEYRVLRLGR